MQKWRKLLIPFSLLYAPIILLRNWLYGKGVFHSQKYDFPVICIGNLSMGGTGKSPAIEWLIRLLQNDFSLATLSRGYKRTSKGFLDVTENSNSKEVGDEPLQFKLKFPTVKVAVDENRVNGIATLQSKYSPKVILLDDAFQHRRVQAGLTILLTVFDDLYLDDWILPAGNLRETTHGAKRADIIIITKCPSGLSENQRNSIAEKFSLLPHQSLFFAYIDYAEEIIFADNRQNFSSIKAFTLVTGIANPKPLVNKLKRDGKEFKHLAFPDHHSFSESELKNLLKEEFILTTEKDYVRLKDYIPKEKIAYLPIQMKLFEEEKCAKIVREFCFSFY